MDPMHRLPAVVDCTHLEVIDQLIRRELAKLTEAHSCSIHKDDLRVPELGVDLLERLLQGDVVAGATGERLHFHPLGGRLGHLGRIVLETLRIPRDQSDVEALSGEVRGCGDANARTRAEDDDVLVGAHVDCWEMPGIAMVMP